MRLLSLLAATALLSLPLTAAADTLQYSFTETDGNGSASFLFDISSNPSISQANPSSYFILASVPISGTGVSGAAFTESPAIQVYSSNGTGQIFILGTDYFQLTGPQLYTGSGASPSLNIGTFSLSGSLSDATTYSPISGTLTVTDLDLAATPEPSSLALLATGLAGTAGVIRRRLA